MPGNLVHTHLSVYLYVMLYFISKLYFMVGICDSNLHAENGPTIIYSFFSACNSGVKDHKSSQGRFLRKQTLRQRFAGRLLYKIGD